MPPPEEPTPDFEFEASGNQTGKSSPRTEVKKKDFCDAPEGPEFSGVRGATACRRPMYWSKFRSN